jgi:hypothetical protein
MSLSDPLSLFSFLIFCPYCFRLHLSFSLSISLSFAWYYMLISNAQDLSLLFQL